jgi:ribosomal protein L37AE/L43A
MSFNTDVMYVQGDAYNAPYGAKCPNCGSNDFNSDDNYHWKCDDCGHRFTTVDITY